MTGEGNYTCWVAFGAKDLTKKDLFGWGHSDPYLKVSLETVPDSISKEIHLKKIAKTEYVNNDSNPEWKPLKITFPDYKSELLFAVYDKDTFSSDEFIGSCKTNLETICNIVMNYADNQYPPLQLKDPKNDKVSGQLFLKFITNSKEEALKMAREMKRDKGEIASNVREAAEKVMKAAKKAMENPCDEKDSDVVTKELLAMTGEGSYTCWLGFCAKDLAKKDFFGWGHSDPYIKVSLVTVPDSVSKKIHLKKIAKTEYVNNDSNPEWKPLKITFPDYNSRLLFEVYDKDTFSRNVFIGSFRTSLETICNNMINCSDNQYPSQPKDPKNAKEIGEVFLKFITNSEEEALTMAREMKGDKCEIAHTDNVRKAAEKVMEGAKEAMENTCDAKEMNNFVVEKEVEENKDGSI